MNGRTVIEKLTSADTPLDLEPVVESIMEVDRLFWLDPTNKNLKVFERKFVPGEELPKQLPTGTREVKGVETDRTVVLVSRTGRLFMVDGVPTLMIEDNPPSQKPALPKAKRDHNTGDALNEFRKFMAEYSRQVALEREARRGVRPSAEERAAQSEKDKLLAAERRATKRAERALVAARKGNRGAGNSAGRDTAIQPAS